MKYQEGSEVIWHQRRSDHGRIVRRWFRRNLRSTERERRRIWTFLGSRLQGRERGRCTGFVRWIQPEKDFPARERKEIGKKGNRKERGEWEKCFGKELVNLRFIS